MDQFINIMKTLGYSFAGLMSIAIIIWVVEKIYAIRALNQERLAAEQEELAYKKMQEEGDLKIKIANEQLANIKKVNMRATTRSSYTGNSTPTYTHTTGSRSNSSTGTTKRNQLSNRTY